ncbi:MAG: flavin reductase family protein [Hyphomicrobiaceae bacterium]|nr:flavin reductase family protein [Hyphomicrobiaceae bacterium]
MFYEPLKGDHGLPKNPFNSLVIPRPIGWISSVDSAGVVNLAPYSFFNAVAYRPPTVMFSVGHGQVEDDGKKDTLRNVLETGEFVQNFVTMDNRAAMNATSADLPKDVDELLRASLTPLPSRLVKPPRVAESPIHFECKVVGHYDLPNTQGQHHYTVVFGEVLGIHIDDAYITADGQIDVARLVPLARLGYQDYASVTGDKIFTMERP